MKKKRVLHVINWIGQRGSERTCLNSAKYMGEYEHVFLAKELLSDEALAEFKSVGEVILQPHLSGDFFNYENVTDEYLTELGIDLLTVYLPGDDCPEYLKSITKKKVMCVLCAKKCNFGKSHVDAVYVLSEYASTLNPQLNPEWAYPTVERAAPTKTKKEVLLEYFPDAAPENAMIISRIGSIETVKHVEDFLRIAGAMKHEENLYFLYAGIGDQRYINQLTSHFNLPNTAYAGVVTEQEKNNVNAHSDLCLYPTEFESFGLSLAEPMAHGVPVITYNESACVETVGAGGVIVEFNDLSAMRLALVDLITRPLERARLGKIAQERWVREFSPGRHSKIVSEIYGRVLNE